jgi:hypothetical protein
MPVWLGLLIGIVLVVLTWTIILFTVVVPRALRGPGRLSVSVNRATRWIFFRVSRLARTYEGKDAVLAPIGAVALIAQLLVWLFLIGAACVVMLVPYTHDLGTAVSQVGAAMFTLGVARSASATNDTITTFAAASGFIVIALQIAYLPALYAAFNRREALITMLVSRAGEPSWGPRDPHPTPARRHCRLASRAPTAARRSTTTRGPVKVGPSFFGGAAW